MDIKKWIPWNWFKKEEEDAGKALPVRRAEDSEPRYGAGHPAMRLHQEIDRIFDHALRGMGVAWPTLWGRDNRWMDGMAGTVLKPTLDLGATDKAYTISVEIPGVDENDVRLEIVNNTLTIHGEKKQENEEKKRDYYRMERSYGAFQRVLSLPGDVDQEGIAARFKKGVLTITLPRNALPHQEVKHIAVQTEA